MSDGSDQLREALVEASRRACLRGIQSGDGGNVSARCPEGDRMLVTASGRSLGDASPEAFLLTDLAGTVLAGEGRPTREALLHGRLYQARPGLGAIVHVHAPYAIAVAHRHDEVPRVTWHARLKLPGRVPVLDVPSPVVRDEDWPIVAAALHRHPDLSAFVLRDHGVVALGADPLGAENVAELVEETAQIAHLIAGPPGPPDWPGPA